MKKTSLLSCILLVLAFSLSGCLGMMKNTPYQAISPQGEEALVYVYRPDSVWFRGVPYTVYAGDEKHEPLITNGYFPIHLKPGNVFFRLTRKPTLFTEQRVDAVEMTVENGKIYYLKVNPRPYGAFKFIIMNNDEGATEIAKTKFYYTDK